MAAIRRAGVQDWLLEQKEREGGVRKKKIRTDPGGPDALGDLLAQCLAERDLAFFEHAVQELALSAQWSHKHTFSRGRGTHDRVELGGPLLRHSCGWRSLLLGEFG